MQVDILKKIISNQATSQFINELECAMMLTQTLHVNTKCVPFLHNGLDGLVSTEVRRMFVVYFHTCIGYFGSYGLLIKHRPFSYDSL